MRKIERHGRESEEVLWLAGPVGLAAPHGGGIEPGTDVIALQAANDAGASLYVFRGSLPAGNKVLHQPSHRLQASGGSGLLAEFVAAVAIIFTIHGHRRGDKRVYVGGGNRGIATAFAQAAQARMPSYEWIAVLERIPEALRGMHPQNLVNSACYPGIQLELPASLRQMSKSAAGELQPRGDALVLATILAEFTADVQMRIMTGEGGEEVLNWEFSDLVVPVQAADCLDLHAFAPSEVGSLLDEYFFLCLRQGLQVVRVIHGKGRGILRQRVHRLLARDPRVESFWQASSNAGGWGATMIKLRNEPEETGES